MRSLSGLNQKIQTNMDLNTDLTGLEKELLFETFKDLFQGTSLQDEDLKVEFIRYIENLELQGYTLEEIEDHLYEKAKFRQEIANLSYKRFKAQVTMIVARIAVFLIKFAGKE